MTQAGDESRPYGAGPDQADVDAVRGLLDLMANFASNDQRARYLLSSNWLRERGAAAAELAQQQLDQLRAQARRD